MKSVVFVVPKLGIGGVERSLVSLLQQMPARRYDVTLLTFSPGGELEVLVPEQVTLCCDESMSRQENARAALSCLLQKVGTGALFRTAKSLYHKIGARSVSRPTFEKQFDIAIAYADGLATWYTARSVDAGVKIAFVHTDVQRAGYHADREREAYAKYDRIFFGSQASLDAFVSLMPEYAGKTGLLPNGIDSEKILRLAEQGDPYPHEEVCRLLTVGRLSHEKGVRKIPKLLRMLKDAGHSVVWYVVGDGPERENLLRSAQKLGVAKSLVLTGIQENPYIYMKGCDVYVQPSDFEGFCIALAEARVLCTPSVACDFSGAAEQIEHGVDGFVTGMSVEELFPAVEQLVDSVAMRAAFSQVLLKKRGTAQVEARIQTWWNGLDDL